MNKKKVIHPVDIRIIQRMREILRDCPFSISEVAKRAKVNRASLQNFYDGKQDMSIKSLNKVLLSLPDEWIAKFGELILIPLESEEVEHEPLEEVKHTQ